MVCMVKTGMVWSGVVTIDAGKPTNQVREDNRANTSTQLMDTER